MYNTYKKDRVIPTISTPKSYTSYMKVEDVLRYLNIFNRTLPINQYKIGDFENHFFKCVDVAGRIGDKQFRAMECDLTQYLIENK